MWELSGSNPMKIRKEILRNEMIDFFLIFPLTIRVRIIEIRFFKLK